jgi:nucleolar pre-ribosomal-associated protein 2
MQNDPGVRQSLLTELLTIILSSWKADSAASVTEGDSFNRAFSSHCLTPTLTLLDLLRSAKLNDPSAISSKQVLERLVAIHVIFPARSTFNEKDARKWKHVHDVLLYEQLEAMLKGIKKRILLDEEAQQDSGSLALSWMIFDIAVRSIPFGDFRRRQAEQPWLDALFVCLAHLLWPDMPRITSTGVVQNPIATNISQEPFLATLEQLTDTALARKLRMSLPVLSYFLSAILASNQESVPWTLLVKIIQLDVNTLIPGSGLSKSEELLKQLLDRLQASTVPISLYDAMRNDLIIPLLRGFARSRNLDGFLAIWQQGLADAIRTRYISKYEPNLIPAVLVWEDDDVLDEFKDLSLTLAPQSMGGRLLNDLVGAFSKLAERVGSTADLFANLAIFSALLETSQDPLVDWKLERSQLSELFAATLKALPRKSDYQAQRWRLCKLLRQLLPCIDTQALERDEDQLLRVDNQFVTVRQCKDSAPVDTSRKKSSKFLEGLECFSVVIELAAKSSLYKSLLASQLDDLADLMQVSEPSQSSDNLPFWNGRTFDCDSSDKLIAACIGRLLMRPEILSRYPDLCRKFTDRCLEILTHARLQDGKDGRKAYLKALLQALVATEEVRNTPESRQLVLQHSLDELEAGARDASVDRMLIRSLLDGSMKRAQLKKLATTTTQHLLHNPGSKNPNAIAHDLALLVQLDSLLTGSVFAPKDWLVWVILSKTVSKHTELAPPVSMLSALQMLDHILVAIWCRAQAPVLAEIMNWIKAAIKASEKGQIDQSTLPSLQSFMDQLCHLKESTDETISSEEVQKLRSKFLRVLKRGLDALLLDGVEPANLMMIYLILRAINQTDATGLDKGMQEAVSKLQQRLQALDQPQRQIQMTVMEPYLQLSVECECWKLMPRPVDAPLDAPLDERRIAQLQELASNALQYGTSENEQLAFLSTKANILVNQIGPRGWARLLRTLRENTKTSKFETIRPIVTAAIILRAETQHILQDSKLADELAHITYLVGHTQQTVTGLFLTLENCRMVLQLHPLLMNQSTLDKLLASICMIGTYTTSASLLPGPINQDCKPQPADIYDQLCAIVGIVLGRYRRRLSDRYHLLLPVLQKLLRCLFWPGTEVLQDRQHSALTSTLVAFRETLPKWLHESTGPLPPSSAEKFSRLLSSICNPTVAAARSSKKRRHNDLNDETIKARQLAGQHMQYLIAEYARCTLDGQIAPSVKERLMPGMYVVIDSMDREILRAVNAGMDPSSRAIFKGLYEDWTRFGKWDRS